MGYTIKDFTVGQTAYIELTGNASRGKTKKECIVECTVQSIGRKYVTANGIQFRETDANYGGGLVEKTDYCVDFILYPNKQAISDKMEKESLLDKIKYKTDFSKMSLEQLRKIDEIIDDYREL